MSNHDQQPTRLTPQGAPWGTHQGRTPPDPARLLESISTTAGPEMPRPESNRLRIYSFTPQVLISLGQHEGRLVTGPPTIPADARVCGLAYDFYRDMFLVKVESAEFEEVPEGQVIPMGVGPWLKVEFPPVDPPNPLSYAAFNADMQGQEERIAVEGAGRGPVGRVRAEPSGAIRADWRPDKASLVNRGEAPGWMGYNRDMEDREMGR